MRKEDITYQDKLNELKLDISHPNSKKAVFVLLEGESDVRLFRKLFHEDNCKVESIPGGKFKLEACVEELLGQHDLIIGIRDADFIHLDEVLYIKQNIFLTDFHDMEMVLISTDELFASLTSEYTNIPQNKHLALRGSILTTIEKIGYLKWINEKENLELKCQSGFQDLLSFSDTNMNFEEYFSRILAKSPNAKITDSKVILQKIETLRNTEPNPFHLCNGHDFLKAFLKYINQHQSAIKVNDENLASSCRIAYTSNYYQNTALFQTTQNWANENNCAIYNF